MRKVIVLFTVFIFVPTVIIFAQGVDRKQGIKGASIERVIGSASTNIGKSNYSFKVSPHSHGGPVQGDVLWFAEVIGPGGVTVDGVDLKVDPNDSTRVTVTVQDSVVGDVMLYAQYHSTTGKLVRGKPVVVVSRPPGKAITGISLGMPLKERMVVGDLRILPEIWAQYENGSKSLMYVEPGSLQITSSNTDVVSVSPNGDLKALASGTATITVAYKGFTKQVTITVVPITFVSKVYCITAKANPVTSGTVRPSGDCHEDGALITVIATVNQGYMFTNWTEDGQIVSTSPNYTFTVSKERTLVANFSSLK